MLTPQQALEKYFGFSSFREGQEETIQRALNKKHTLLVMPTGSGKSLAYQLPAMLKPGLTLVISPLIALMKDQVDSLVDLGLPATYINSTLPNQEINRRMRAVLEGDVKLLYIAPERLRNRQFTRALANTKVSMLAVDEAHCISQWGHDFRPDYLQIGPTWQAMGRPTLLATTATATPTVQKDILKLLKVKEVQTIVTGFNRPNLTLAVKHTPDDRTKLQTLQALLKRIEGSIIIYSATRRNADDVADFIQNMVGIPARSYHAGLDREWRTRVQNDFMADRVKIVVATNAFGMGVDKPDVRAVIHYNLPGTVEAYYQEAGRAGRDGRPAECVLLYAPDDQRLQEWLINSDTPAYEDLHQVYALLANAAEGEEVHITHQELADHSGLHPVKLRVTLNELEQANMLYHLGNQGSYSNWKILPLSYQALETRADIIEKRAEIRHRLLSNILNYAHLMTCRRKFLLEYFGDISSPEAPNCCDNHIVTKIEDLPKAVTAHDWFPLIVLDTVRSMKHRPVGRNRLAQILNGSRSREIQQFGYDQHRFYGKLGHFSQKQIVQLIDGLIQARYLRIEGGKLPVLHLTSTGLDALEARAALPIRIPDIRYTPTASSSQKSRPGRPDTFLETLTLFNEGLAPPQIAAQRGLAERTIYNHLARLIGEGKIDLHQVVPIEIEKQIAAAIATVGTTTRLTPIKVRLPDTISFEQIKCVIAAHSDLSGKSQALTTDESPTQHLVALGETKNPKRVPTPPLPRSPAPPPPSPSSDQPPHMVVLEAVAKLNGTLGRSGLAKFLTGSRVRWLESFTEHTCYGQLSFLSQQAVIDIIDALIADGKLAATGGHRPKVKLSPPAASAPPAKETPETKSSPDAPDVGRPTPPPPPSPPPLAELHPGEPATPQDRHHLLETLRAWRTSEARNQNMPAYIIFSNKVLEAIASQTPTTLAALAQVSGVGPAKLEKYGQAVIDLITEAAGPEIPQKQPPLPPLPPPPSSPQRAPAAKSSQSKIENRKPKIENAVMSVVADLDGLLTPQTLAQILTAAPGDVVPFSDSLLCGAFYGKLSPAEIEREIQQAIEAGRIGLSPHQRLILIG